MACKLAVAVLFGMVVNTLGEQHLRAQPGTQASLSTEAAHPKNAAVVTPQAPRSTNMQKIISFWRGPEQADDEIVKVTDFKEFSIMNSSETLISFLIWLALYGLFAAYYHKNVLMDDEVNWKVEAEEERTHWKDFQEFKSGLFDCSQRPDICFWACCCVQIRWADTMSKLDIHRFWPGFLLLTALMCISWIPVCTLICHVIVVSYFTYHRQEFRKIFDFEEQGQGACFKDCCAYFFCACCAVAQEARHARDACIVNHPAIKRIGERECEKGTPCDN